MSAPTLRRATTSPTLTFSVPNDAGVGAIDGLDAALEEYTALSPKPGFQYHPGGLLLRAARHLPDICGGDDWRAARLHNALRLSLSAGYEDGSKAVGENLTLFRAESPVTTMQSPAARLHSPMSAYFESPAARLQSPMSAYFDPAPGQPKQLLLSETIMEGSAFFPEQLDPLPFLATLCENITLDHHTRIGEQEVDGDVDFLPENPSDLAWESDDEDVQWSLPQRYRAGRLIGAGSYGAVCVAHDAVTDQKVAVKKIEEVFQSLTTCKRILREVAILSNLKHNNIVQIIDLPVPANLRRFDDLFIVMELCESDLSKVCEHPEGISLPQLRRLAYGMLVGCSYLHAAGVVHRDLKPANCLVNRDCTVKICDFNLARTVARTEDVPSSPSSPNMQMRTMRRTLTAHVASRWYRAPEVLLQLGYSEAMDVWSAGCIIAELFGALNTGNWCPGRKPLFPGESSGLLSLDSTADEEAFENDQLDVVFDVIGTPCQKEKDLLDKWDVLHKLFGYRERPGCGLRACLPEATEDGLDLLEKMLKFMPGSRITMAEALQQPFFARVCRNLESERVATEQRPNVSDINFDENEEDGLWALALRHQFQQEIGRFHTLGGGNKSSILPVQ